MSTKVLKSLLKSPQKYKKIRKITETSRKFPEIPEKIPIFWTFLPWFRQLCDGARCDLRREELLVFIHLVGFYWHFHSFQIDNLITFRNQPPVPSKSSQILCEWKLFGDFVLLPCCYYYFRPPPQWNPVWTRWRIDKDLHFQFRFRIWPCWWIWNNQKCFSWL